MTGTIELERRVGRKTDRSPTGRWKNRWLYTRDLPTACCVKCDEPGGVVAGEESSDHCGDYPSEGVARDTARRLHDTAVRYGIRYLGPVPVEGA